MERIIKLRAHHLLCMQGFQGYGYSEEFTKNMKVVIDALKNDAGIKIQIVDCCDDICACCPNNIEGICKDKDKVDIFDRKTLNKLQIKSGYEILSENLFTFANKNFKGCEDKEDICRGCCWTDICLWIKNK